VRLPVAINATDDSSPETVVHAVTPETIVPAVSPGGRSRGPQVNVTVVALIGVLITAGLSVGARTLHDSNEKRLLRQRAREVAAVVAAAIPSVQTPLLSAAVLAEATHGDAAAFRGLVTPIVATGRPFVSVSLWSTRVGVVRPLVVVGVKPELQTAQSHLDIQHLLRRAAGKGKVTIDDLLVASDRRVGYALTVPSQKARYVVYAEAALPANRRAAIDRNSAFADLDYALYLGRRADPRSLLASSTGGALLGGRRASVTVPFGDSKLLVVLSPQTELGGTLLARLWWMLAALGLLLTLGATRLVDRLTRRRRDAEALAGENARLYAQQRSVAQTLQQSLLAEAFPEVGGLEFAARYIAGEEGIDIGGDWYDVVRLERGNTLMVVGDVSGRGLEAATMMASLRYAARAYGVEEHSPATVLSKLARLLSIPRDGHFATVLCGLLDVSAGRMTLANAGHPEPLLITGDQATFVATSIGVPVGVGGGAQYSEVEFAFPRGSTLLLYTDGAIERRGEDLDVGRKRLKDAGLGAHGSLEDFLDQIVSGVVANGAEDDTALLAVRWLD
jgi:serine phosphatase RsbU (regulator of sigma subunit)